MASRTLCGAPIHHVSGGDYAYEQIRMTSLHVPSVVCVSAPSVRQDRFMVNSDPVPPGATNDDRGFPLEAVIRDTGAAVIVLDAALRVRAINEAACELVGLQPPSVVGRCLSALVPPAVFEERRQLIVRLLAGEPAARTLEVLFGCVTATTYRCIAAEVGDNDPEIFIMLRPVRSSDEYKQLRATPTIRRMQHHHLGPLSQLTVREIQVLRMIGLGMSTQEMAKALHRSVKTIEFHRMTLGGKLKAGNRVDLARIAFERRLTCLCNDELETVLRQCNLADDDAREAEPLG